MSIILKIKGFGKTLSNIKEKIVRFGIEREGYHEIGKFSVNRIKSFTRSGKSIVTGSKFKPLSQSYISYRSGKVTFWQNENGKLIAAPIKSNLLKKTDSEFFSKKRSNLTFTGQMINSIVYKIIQFGVKIFLKGSRNNKVAKYVSVERPFMGMDEIGFKRINAIIKRTIRKKFSRKRK